MDDTSAKLGGYSLIPFAGFLLLYIGAGIWFTISGKDMAFYQFPAPSCALFGFGLALLIGYKNVNAHIKTFTSGIGDETVITMCLIFLLAGGFSTLTKAMGGVDATVQFGLFLLPDRFILPGIFLISCLISFSMGTSMGTIGTVMPIAIGISETSGLDLAMTTGAVLGGAMFGDNLSIISDTTIAATGTQGCAMRDKTLYNLKIAIPAACIVVLLFIFLSKPTLPLTPKPFSLWQAVPYALVTILAIRGVHVVIVLMLGILSAIIIGSLFGSFSLFDVGKITYDGFITMAEVFFVTVLIAGLAAIASKEGGLDVLLKKVRGLAKTKKSAEATIALFVSFADICVANNTVAILLVGGMTKKLAERFNIEKARAAGLLDIFSCVWQGIIPHGAQLLLAGGLAHISIFHIIPWAFYPFALAFFGVLSIWMGGLKTRTKGRASS